jgi:hypothetical protein
MAVQLQTHEMKPCLLLINIEIKVVRSNKIKGPPGSLISLLYILIQTLLLSAALLASAIRHLVKHNIRAGPAF